MIDRFKTDGVTGLKKTERLGKYVGIKVAWKSQLKWSRIKTLFSNVMSSNPAGS